MRNMLWLAHLAIPELRFLHRIEVDSPEESTVLLDNAGLGVYFLHAFGAHRHGWHLAGSDLSRAFQSMRVQLQLLQHSSGRFGRWVLKCPFTVAHIGAFLDVFPDATVIHVHRDASKALSSVCRLATTLQTSFLLRPDLKSIGAFWSTYYLDALERSWQFRRAHPSRQIIDVSYSDLVRDPVETAMKLQKPLGLVLDPDLLSAVPGTARHAGDNTEKVIDFGIDDSEIRQRFLAYDLGQPSETRASKAPRQ